MENEVWKDVVGYEGFYRVSSQGRLFCTDKTRCGPRMAVDTGDNGAGYMVNRLKDAQGGMKMQYRHRLVAKAFFPNPYNLPQAGHKDDDKRNNAADNLYWCEGSTNIQDAHKTGRMKKRSDLKTIKRYSDDEISMAYRAVKMESMGVAETARFFGMPRTTLSSFMNKRAKAHITDPIDLEFAQ